MILRPGDQLWRYGDRGERLYVVVSVDTRKGTATIAPSHPAYRDRREKIASGDVAPADVIREGGGGPS